MEKWLYYILNDNTIVDNQEYCASNGVLYNHRIPSGALKLSQRVGKQHTKVHNNNKAIWSFLYHSYALQQDNKNDVFLFNNKEYENNTDDKLVDVSGRDARNFRIRTGNLIGYIRSGEYALKVSSRFGDNFLKYIIADADGFLSVKDKGGDTKGSYEWLLVYLWSIKLKKAYRLGLPKEYKSFTEELKKAKGQIDPLYYYKHHKTGQYKCNYREYSYDTLQAALILEAFNKVKKHIAFVNGLHSIRTALATATRGIRLKPSDLYQAQHFSNPFYSDYNDVIDLSKSILRDEFSGFGAEKNSDAFLFDVSMLFEYFVKKLLMRSGWILRSKFSSKLTIPTGTREQKLQPDLLIETVNGLAVFDVKYKNFDRIYGVKREDLFQLHTYIGRYGNDESIASCGFIYPNANDKNEIIQQTIQFMGKIVPFYVCLLGVPVNKNDNFNESFRNQCTSFVEEIHNILN